MDLPGTPDAASTSKSTALTPKSRLSKLRIRTPTSSPRLDTSINTPPNQTQSPIDQITPSFSRNLHKLLTTNKRQKVEVASLRNQVEKLVQENDTLDRAATTLQTRVDTLEQEHADLRSVARETERARRRAEQRLISLSARSASPARRARAPLPLDTELASASVHDRALTPADASTSCTPLTSATAPAPAHKNRSPLHQLAHLPAGGSLPTRSTASPYRDYQELQQNDIPRRSKTISPTRAASIAARLSGFAQSQPSTRPQSRCSAELPPLASSLASSPASAYSPLPETPTSENDSTTPFFNSFSAATTATFVEPASTGPSRSNSMGKRLSALLGGLSGSPSKAKKRPALDILALTSAEPTEVRMVMSTVAPTLQDAMAASKPANTRSTSPNTMTRSSSNGSSSRKATPGSTVSKSSGGGANAVSSSWNGRTLVFGEATESGRRGISRPMDTANSSVSTSSHHSHALPRTSVDTHGAVAERDPKDRRGSVEGRRSQLSAVRGRGFEHGAFAFEKPRIAPPLGSSLTPPTHQRPSLHSTNSANGSVNVVRNVEEGAKDGQFGSTSSRGRSGTDRSTRSKPQTEEINEKSGMFFGLGRTASTGATKRQPAIDEKRRGGSLREKRERSDTYAAEELSPKRKSSGSSLTRLWIQKTKEALCAGRPPSPLSRTEPPRIVRTSAKTTTTNGAVAHANASPQQPGQAAAAARKRKPLPISTHLPMFRFEPASAAGRMTPDSMHSRGTSGTHGGTGPREVTFKIPDVPQHAKERAAAAAAVSVAAAKVQFNHATNTPKSSKKRDSGGSGSDAGTQNLYDAFCGELRRVVGDDAFVVFEKYVRQYEDKVFPLLGPRGLIERLKKILDLSHAGEDRKREVVDRFLQVVRSSEAAS